MEHWEGSVEGYRDGRIVGWVWSPLQPSARISLEVIVDGIVQTLGIANLSRADLLACGCGDGQHGFSIPFFLLEGQAASVRIANSSIVLPGEARGTAPSSAIDGYAEASRGLAISGWCWDKAAPERALHIEAIVDGKVVASAIADEERGDLIEAEIGNGKHAFNIHLPSWMADGRERDVVVQTEDGTVLKGCPVQVAVFLEGPRSLLGSIVRALPADRADHTMAQALMLDRYLRQIESRLPHSLPWHDYEIWRIAFATLRNGDDPAPVAVPSYCVVGDRVTHETIPYGTYRPEVVVVVDPFARLLPGALHRALQVFAKTNSDILYADAEVETQDGLRPWFRPSWSYDLFLAQDYTSGIFLVRSSLLEEDASWLPIPILKVRAVEAANPDRILHLPEVLSHLAGTGACADGWVPAIQDHVSRRGYPGIIEPLTHNGARRRVRWPIPYPHPLVSLIIPTRDRHDLLSTCIDSIVSRTTYPNYEIIVIDNQSEHRETIEYLQSEATNGRIRVVRYNSYFNFSDMNNVAAGHAKGSILGFINNDVELISQEWLEEMVGILARPEVGVVGARLLYRNDMIQHGGIVVGVDGLAENTFQHVHRNDDGYFGRTQVAGNYSAVTAACLFCKAQTFQSVGGFDAEHLPVTYNDVDLCLRIREHGKLVVWTPHVELYHDESASRGRDIPPDRQARALKEELYMRERWRYMAAQDPYYNPNLNLDRRPFTGMALPPRDIQRILG